MESHSMATVWTESLAAAGAGVPLREHAKGVSIGLVPGARVAGNALGLGGSRFATKRACAYGISWRGGPL